MPRDHASPSRPPPVGRDRLRRAWPVVLVGGILALSVLQFALYRARVPRPQPLASLGRFDGVVVFTGGAGRIAHALALLKAGHTRRLLVSGVHERVGPAVFARTFHVEDRLVACCITLDHAARDTAGNAREAVEWARRLELARVGVVSAAWHLPRGMFEIERHRRARGLETRFVPLPVATGEGPRTNWRMMRESVKYWLAHARAVFDEPPTAPADDRKANGR